MLAECQQTGSRFS